MRKAMLRLTVALSLLVAAVAAPRGLRAQPLPGTGGECNQACGVILDSQGREVGNGCINQSSSTGRNNCKATSTGCTTDPCESAVLDGFGRIMVAGRCRTLGEELTKLQVAARETAAGTQRVAWAARSRPIVAAGEHHVTRRSAN